MHVLLTFDDVDGLAGSDGFEHAGQPVEHAPRLVELPDPAPAAVGTALPEILRLEADRLEEQRTRLVDVVVLGDDCAAVLALEQVGELEVDRGQDVGGLAAGLALEEDAAVVADADREARVRVVVVWTASKRIRRRFS
ncbi:MAG: hypothetical protein ACXVRJ_12815 [Gaiellaceae bacterium]